MSVSCDALRPVLSACGGGIDLTQIGLRRERLPDLRGDPDEKGGDLRVGRRRQRSPVSGAAITCHLTTHRRGAFRQERVLARRWSGVGEDELPL